ncbi:MULTISPECIES: YajG family lipoprotein [unclassified Pseudoalteromonas]|uniref:YajG family lipoprotein n=1 Tax=unclassified Pseudoalteromonas TaxID=194690 RepID=UPI0025B47B47|nr:MULTISPECIES: YajG family lipoprotein [unclassified Pseudoalteromonas]MDN3378927.1 YajG family lipoprotein [Pseudoalteromonas sp. APC 3893]MDN3387573.1 YajG family lipoprotein [Pseudoalteromonas sp. APC 4017]
MKNYILPCCILLALGGCSSSQPNQLILNPVYQSGKVSSINQSLSTSVIDLRGDAATLKLIKSDKTQTIASQGITESIKSILDSALSRNGASISNLATTRFEVDIHTLQAVVTEQMVTHISNAKIELGVRVIRSSSNFSKIYRGNANLEGPLGHDRAKIEGQLNKLTEQLITRMVSDPELLAFLEG